MTAMHPAADDAPARGRAAALRVALVGRQNSGKTSLLMHLTGTAQRPVNFPGTSVEGTQSECVVDGQRLVVSDLPGISSLHALSGDESVTLQHLEDGSIDVLCAVLDASKLRIELDLLRSLVELGHPVVVALTKLDVARAEGRPVNGAALAELLQVPVIETDGLRGKGVQWLRQALVQAPGRGAARTFDPRSIDLAGTVQSAPAPRKSLTDRLDAFLLHPWLGLPVLLLVMLGMFQLVFSGADPFVGLIEDGQGVLSAWIESFVAPGAWRSFLVDGLVNGVGSIVVFLPQIVLLVALVSVMEATGYMARAAFLLDRALGRVGLSGRSFVPLTTSFACAVPGILASRIIGNERDRIATVVVAPLMSCSARLPVYVVMIGAFFPVAWAGTALFGLYALGIVSAAVVALVLRATVLRGGQSPLMMELPSYQRPSWRVVWGQIRVAVRSFVVMAGTVIFFTSIAIWFLSYYPRPDDLGARFEQRRADIAALAEPERAEAAEQLDAEEQAAYLEQSWLARAGKAVQPVFAPAGFDWRTTVGILAAFPARELVVPTMGVLFRAGDVDPGDYDTAELADPEGANDGLRRRLRNAVRADGTRAFDGLIAFSLMVFFALCSQCAATLGAIRRETRSWVWPVFTFVYMTGLAWVAAVAVYQIGGALGWGGGS